MCTAILSVDPSAAFPVLLAGVRDEFMSREWQPPAAHWPDRPRLIGGRDLLAGGTWLAVDPVTPRVGCVLNALGPSAPEDGRRSRGELPLLAAAEGGLGGLARSDMPRFDPFHLLCADRAGAWLWSWDGVELVERPLGPGLHLIVNSGLDGELAKIVPVRDATARTVGFAAARGPGEGDGDGDGAQGSHAAPVREDPPDPGAPWHAAAPQAGGLEEGVALMSARAAHFRPRLLAATRPRPHDGTAARAWGDWLPLVDGDGLDRTDPRSLLPRRDAGDGRMWGTTSVSLVAIGPHGVRYDFSAAPGDPHAWTRVI